MEIIYPDPEIFHQKLLNKSRMENRHHDDTVIKICKSEEPEHTNFGLNEPDVYLMTLLRFACNKSFSYLLNVHRYNPSTTVDKGQSESFKSITIDGFE